MARLLVLSLLVLCTAAAAADLSVSGAWIRKLPADVPAGGYFVLKNTGGATALVGASAPDYGMVMIHETVEKGGTSRMVHVERIEVPAGGGVEFRPGGYHLMLMRAKRDIAVGTKVLVTLEFSDGRSLTVPFEVRGPGAR